jgi:2-aminoadipate transaminase
MNPQTPWTLARRAERMNPSVIREILKVTERPGIISFAGGLPSAKTFPVTEFAEACATVLRNDAQAALQYAASEGFGPLVEMVAERLPWKVDPAQILITTGSQQGLDLVAKVLIDSGSRVLVETPTFLGALQAFAPMEPEIVSVRSDDAGVDIADLGAKCSRPARFLYVLPNFQNPTGRTMTESRRAELVKRAAELGLPLVEDNPYGDLWFDAPPPPPLTARNPDGAIYLGSFSKVLAPGLRLGFTVAPKAVFPKLLQAKQAADLHSPGFNQRMIAEVMKGGFLDRHVPTIRALYKTQRDAMLAALEREMPQGDGDDDSRMTWNKPDGGMFLWARLPKGMDAVKLLPKAVDKGVAFVPGLAFFADNPDPRSLRLSFVTPSVPEIERGVAALAAAVRENMPAFA